MEKFLDDALNNGYAIPQINTNGVLWMETILETAEYTQSPVIIGTTDKIVPQLGGFKFLVKTYKMLKEKLNITVPVTLHLDHGQTIESCFQAVEAGYESVMFDGSKLSIKENINKTKKVVDFASHYNVAVEAEVGSVGGIEDGMYSDMMYADIDECLQLVKESGIYSLAPALGSVHGKYKGEPDLGFQQMETLRNHIDVPFVLHGASGISNADLKKAISFGHAKINYNTEVNIAWAHALRKVLNDHPDLYAPMEVLKPSKEAMRETIEEIFKRTEALGRAKE